nr:uncharacterized mitochondrial protein AtMg00810-like [Tanacetum cinerariifolium]
MGLWYPKDSSFELTAFSDADHAGCIDTHKSTSGGIQFLCDKLVSWMSKKHKCTTMSSTEAEYVVLSASCTQVMWMRTQLQDYGFNYKKIPLYCDSQIEYQLTDMFTKALSEDRFKYLVRRIGTMAGVDINTLIMEQYLALSHENQAPGVVKPEIQGNINFEIKSQFMQELKEDTFSGNKNKDAHDHIDQVLNIVSLFNIPGVSQDVVLLRVFPFTLTGAAKRWVDRLTPGTVNTWDLLKKAFI